MKAKFLFILFATLICAGTVTAAYSSVVSQYPHPTFQTYYGEGAGAGLSSRLTTYWPALGDESCKSRQDLVLQVAPAGCQPMVVRSDLLAEQDVPVFCQIDALQLNPLLDIKELKDIRFDGRYPAGVLGAGFHPAKAALRTRDTLLGSPLINNVGYVVVVLKKQSDERKQPEFVTVNLTAQIDYNAGNAFGVGAASFILEPQSDQEWNDGGRQTFWQGRYAMRLEEVSSKEAVVSIYEGDKKVTQTRVLIGGVSSEVYVPGYYCQAGIKIHYDSFDAPEGSARLEIDTGKGIETVDVYKGSKLLNRCTVESISVDQNRSAGQVVIECGSQTLKLSLKSRKIIKTGNDILGPDESKKLRIETTKSGRKICQTEIKQGQNGFLGTEGIYSIQRAAAGSLFGAEWKLYREKNDLTDAQRSEQWAINLKNELAAKCESRESLLEQQYDAETEKWFTDSIKTYEDVAQQYPAEQNSGGTGTYGEEALAQAIVLAENFHKQVTMDRLMREYLERYPTSNRVAGYKETLERVALVDAKEANDVVTIDGRVQNIRVKSFKAPSIVRTNAVFSVNGNEQKLRTNTPETLALGGGQEATVYVTDLKANQADVTIVCPDKNARVGEVITPYSTLDRLDAAKDKILSAVSQRSFELSRNMQVGKPYEVCGKSVVLQELNLGQVARVRLEPIVRGTETKTNLTVTIGIEKRAIQLSPNKTRDRIEMLNKSIQQWESISKNLGTVVSGLKGACFATSAVLTFKNFYQGLSGEALARQQVMNGEFGWKNTCREQVPNTYPTLDACYLAHADEIEKDVKSSETTIKSVNERIKKIEANNMNTQGTLKTNAVNTDNAKKALAAEVRAKHGSKKVPISKDWGIPGEKQKSEITVEEFLAESNLNAISYSEVRDLYMNLERSGGTYSDGMKKNIDSAMQSISSRVDQNRKAEYTFKQNAVQKAGGLPPLTPLGQAEVATRIAYVTPATTLQTTSVGGAKPPVKFHDGEKLDSTHVAQVYALAPPREAGTASVRLFPTGKYLLGLQQAQDGKYAIKEIFFENPDGEWVEEKDLSAVASFQQQQQVSFIQGADQVSYANGIKDPKVQYFETEPYKGLPAIVPFDIRNGWYAATKQTLPALGGIGAFDASGRVASFWLCNVGINGRVQFNDAGQGDDTCQMINLNTGRPRGAFAGLSEKDAEKKVNQAINAIEEAAGQYQKGGKFVKFTGQDALPIGPPATGVPSTQCQDFMSAKECQLLFNVCDPVICPASRCNFGGAYPVSDVIATGIIGSTLLCLPNYREGVYIPVCLSGIHAGVEGYVSILKNYRDCLSENLESGKVVGICDQISAVYMCEFFWRQLAPIAQVLLPKLLENAYGQGTRGGGEYLTVMGAWDNMRKSVDYFTQVYGVNSFKAFQARSVEEVGTPFCKAFVSAKAPNSFKALVEPDSPPQFHGWFSSVPFTSATVPATSQYKVFYHIFAGKDQGIYFRVYLKNPPSSSYYSSAPTVQVAAGFIAKGQYASETRDFTAPVGYAELCIDVNGKESCGFKQVSTSFAVNQVSDLYVAREAKDSNVQSEKECISGSASLASVASGVVSGNPLDGAVSPEIYKRGVIRVCATRNPGSATNPTRFIDVGFCDDPALRCWLDKQSVNTAISQQNVGVRNQTIQDLQKMTQASLESHGIVQNDAVVNSELKSIADSVRTVKIEKGQIQDATALITGMNTLFEQLYWNHHKAQLMLLRGTLQEKVARVYLWSVQKEAGAKRAAGVTGSGTSGASGAGGSDTASTDTTQRSEEQFDPERAALISQTYVYQEKRLENAQTGFTTLRPVYLRHNGNQDTNVWEWSLDQLLWKPVTNTNVASGVDALTGETLTLLGSLVGKDADTGEAFVTGLGGKVSTDPVPSLGSGSSGSDYTLSDTYDPSKKLDILYKGTNIGLHLQSGNLYITKDSTSRVGIVTSSRTIQVTESTAILRSGITLARANDLHKATIVGNKLIVSTVAPQSGNGKSLSMYIFVRDSKDQYLYLFDTVTLQYVGVYLESSTKILYVTETLAAADWLYPDSKLGGLLDGKLVFNVLPRTQVEIPANYQKFSFLENAQVVNGVVYTSGSTTASTVSPPDSYQYEIITRGNSLWIYDSARKNEVNVHIEGKDLFYAASSARKIGTYSGTLVDGSVSLIQETTLISLGREFYENVHGSKLTLLKISKSSSAVLETYDFKLSEVQSADGKQLLDVSKVPPQIPIYLKGSELFYVSTDTPSRNTEDFTPTLDKKRIGTVSNGKITLYSEVKVLIGDSLFVRLDGAEIKGQGIYSKKAETTPVNTREGFPGVENSAGGFTED